MSLKVLHISAGNLYGGVETLLTTIVRERSCCPGMEPHFAVCFEDRLSSELRELGVPVTILGGVQTRFPWTIWRARRRLTQLLRKERFDAVICHMTWSLPIFGPTVHHSGMPLIFWMHDAAKGEHWLERWAGRTIPDLVLCNSQFTASTLPKLFPRRLPPHEIIHSPISDRAPVLSQEERVTLRRELVTAANACVIIQVGRMEPYKGHALHLDALARLANVPGWTCWMVGGAQRPYEARYFAELKSRAKRAGIANRVRFLGERRDVPRLLQASDIFCQPNIAPEPFGIVFIEALYAGLPIVATSHGGALEIVDELSGQLVPPNNPVALADSLRNSMLNLRENLSPQRRARAQLLSEPAVILKKLETYLTRLCSPTAKATSLIAALHL
jgi:glycosyltransferase involved in cell wall biosynthesis